MNLRLKSSSDAWNATIAASMSALARCGLRVSRRLEVDEHPFDVLPGGLQAIDRGDFCLYPLGLAFASNSSMRVFAARICAAILSS